MSSFKGVQDGILEDSRRSAELNDIGITQLKQCQYVRAINSFGSALKLLNKILSSPRFDGLATRHGSCDQDHHQDQEDVMDHEEFSSDDQCTCDDHPEDGKNMPHVIDDRDVVPAEGDPESTKPSHHDDSEDNRILNTHELDSHEAQFYKKPIEVPAALLASSPTYAVVVEMSITIMFNFALSHHLAATFGQVEDTSKTMEQAVALYELTHTLQLQEGIELSVEYTMATICNLGQIHRVRGDADKASKCFQHLLAIIVFLQSQNHLEEFYLRDDRSSSNGEDSVRNLLNTDVFFQSVSYLMLRDSSAAAAA